MMSTKDLSIICRYGGDFVEESNNEVFYKGGTNRNRRLEAQEINYSSLLSMVCEVCRWSRTQIGSIKYKHPEYGLDCLMSLENDEDIDTMIKNFSQNNGSIQLFVFETQEKLPLHKKIIPSTGKEVAENHQGSKEMPRPNSTMNINAETAGVPTVGLRSGMENELAVDNRSVTTNNRTDHGYASDTSLASRMELEEGRETSFQPSAKTAGMPTDDLQLEIDHEFGTDNNNLPRNDGIEYGCADDMLSPLQPGMETEEGQEMPLQRNSNMGFNAKIAGMPTHNLQSRTDHEFGTDNHNLSSKDGAEYYCDDNNKALPLRPRMELEEGQEFPDENAFHKFLRQYAINLNFEYKRTRSGHGRFAASCIKKDCPWKIRVLRLSNQSTFKIKSLERKHTCDLGKHLERTTHRQATMEWIADIVEDGNYLQRAPEFVTGLIKKKYGFNINYHKAWRGIKLACKRRNSVGNSCQGYDSDYNVEKICEDIRRTNPGSRVLQCKSADRNYLKLFISYEAAVIPIFRMVGRRAVELFRVKVGAKRPFVWLLATGRDTDERALLLACGFIELDEEEEDLLEDYKWFCEELFHILSQITNLAFIVDYTHDGKVLEVVRSIFRHSHCRFDQSSFQTAISYKFDTLNPWLLWRAMSTLKQFVFDEQMSEMLEQCGEAWEFLRNVNLEYWARFHFKGDLGIHMSFDPLGIIKCRHKKDVSIVELVEHLHNLMMERFTERVKSSSSWKSILLPRYENNPSIDATISRTTTPVRFRVSYLGSDDCEEVDIEMRHCSCNRWQMLGFPCHHAETVIKALQQNRYDYWDDCYKTTVYKEAYSQAVIHSLPRRCLIKKKLVNETIPFLEKSHDFFDLEDIVY